ncbi:MAG: hypothetical protein JSR17_00250 [Proteobacteria bacterium]|nr:hypothetical protein [Pseudomonadota bacterium]
MIESTNTTHTPVLASSNSITYLAPDKIQQMIKPLEKLGGIKYFNYAINYADNTGYDLLTHPSFYDSWFKHNLPLPSLYLKNGWYLGDRLLSPEVLACAHSEDLGNFLVYINRQQDKTTIYGFATGADNKNSITFYKENIGLLIRFGKYFEQDLAQDLIKDAENQKIIIDRPLPSSEKIRDVEPFYAIKDIKLLDTLKDREKEYLEFLLKGYNNNEISVQAELSPKTVFKYLSNIRKKLNCRSKSEVYEKLINEGYLGYYVKHPDFDLPLASNGDLHAFFEGMYSPISKLSSQEYQCYKLVLKGYTLAEISNALQISIPTVADYITRLKVKLRCRSKHELISQALNMGLMDIT